LSAYLLCHLGPPWNDGRSCWTNFRGLCQEQTCRRYLRGSEGIFCANFWDQRGKFAPYQGAWCPQCLKAKGNIDFPVALHLDDEGEAITSDQEEKRFREARGGDHLITPFQCETCHFRNIYARDPVDKNLVDIETMVFIRQAILDSFWSREPTTVRANLQEAKRGAKSARRFAFPGSSSTPPMGPFPLRDDFGMMGALVVLDRSLDSRRYADYV
jgi:hypothetical protein